jgi:gliding motility-associated-like protein
LKNRDNTSRGYGLYQKKPLKIKICIFDLKPTAMIVNKSVSIVLFVLFIGTGSSFAGNPAVVKVQNFQMRQWSFVENKGQLADQGGKIIKDVKYYSHSGPVHLYCRPGMISFVFTRTEKERLSISEATGIPAAKKSTFNIQHSTLTSVRADLLLLHSNPSATIIPSDQQEYYENFYLAHTGAQGITNVHTFKTITYQNIYPHIDMVLHCRETGMKYEFIVYPGGKVSDIQMQWNGLRKIENSEDGGIYYAFALGKMTESAPKTFLRDGQIIESHFIRKENRIGFCVKKYNKNKVLVIDPDLLWATYFGGKKEDISNGVSTDPFGNVFITGYTQSSLGIATAGAYQTSQRGRYDAFVSKFTTTGSLIWSTYYGGNGNDGGEGIATDYMGNVIMTGTTGSISGIATKGAFQTTASQGVCDSFGGYALIAKFSNSGFLQWGTYFGGNYGAAATKVAIDPGGNIFITGGTQSNRGIATNGVFQTSYTAGGAHGFLAKFSGNGQRIWASYFGSDGGYDAICGIITDNSGSVFISGSTSGKKGMATSSAFQTSYGGGGESTFLAKFDSSGTRKWATYFGGYTLNRASGMSLITDRFGNVYMTGDVSSVTDVATTGAWQTSYGGNSDAFIAKFSSSGIRLWATYFGGAGLDWGSGIVISGYGNIFITGITNSVNGIATRGAYQTSMASPYYHAFLAEFDTLGTRLWATYFGGNDTIITSEIAADRFGNVFIAGRTKSTTGIASQWAYQPTYAGGDRYGDAFLAKFGTRYKNDAGIAAFNKFPANFCRDSISIMVQLKNYGLNVLDSVNISWAVNKKIQTTYKWQGHLLPGDSVNINLGKYLFINVKEYLASWTSVPNGLLDSFRENDSAHATIYNAIPKASAGPDTTLCFNQTYIMQGAGGITYKWSPAKYLDNDTIAHPKATLPNRQLFILKVSNKFGCSDSAQVLLKVRERLKVKDSASKTTACSGEDIILSAIPHGGDSLNYVFSWPGDSATGNPIIIKPKRSGWHKVILGDNCTPVDAVDSIYITVNPPAKAAFDWSPSQYVKINKPVNFSNHSQNASSYLWTFGTKDSSKTTSPIYNYTDTGNYKITLIAYGMNGCPNDTAWRFIQLIDGTVAIYIPNVFTPNGDGINDVFDIKGPGIKQYSYNIYNRWGELVFSYATALKSPAPVPISSGGNSGGWDGTFKGAPAPEEVYIYMITVKDIDDNLHYLHGNVTISR